MAVIRYSNSSENINYIGTLGIFLTISCTVLMLRFKGFKAVLNLSGKQKELSEVEGIGVNSVSIRGAYRDNREEFFGYGSLSQSPQSRITPSMVVLPPSQNQLRPTKSVNDLTQPNTTSELAITRTSTPEISLNPQGTSEVNNSDDSNKLSKQQIKEQKRHEKQRIAQQKKRDKIAIREQIKQDKLQKERERKEARLTKNVNKRNKTLPMQPVPLPRNNPLAQTQAPNSTNTLESSISKSTGPPPYEEILKETTKSKNDTSGNTSFAKPIEDDSWDLVSKHREQMVRPTSNIGGSKPKQMVLDLQFEKIGPVAGRRQNNSDSEADA